VNFEPGQIGKFMSEVLCLGFPDRNGNVVLLNVDRPAMWVEGCTNAKP
jgi:tRNA-binding protein